MASDPARDRRLEEERQQRLVDLERRIASGSDDPDVRPTPISRPRAIKPSYYPRVPIDAGVVEWFMKRNGSSMSMAIDINEVLKAHIRTKERAATKKKAG